MNRDCILSNEEPTLLIALLAGFMNPVFSTRLCYRVYGRKLNAKSLKRSHATPNTKIIPIFRITLSIFRIPKNMAPVKVRSIEDPIVVKMAEQLTSASPYYHVVFDPAATNPGIV